MGQHSIRDIGTQGDHTTHRLRLGDFCGAFYIPRYDRVECTLFTSIQYLSFDYYTLLGTHAGLRSMMLNIMKRNGKLRGFF